MDSIHWSGVVGTLAGDDTILILCKEETVAVNMVEELKKLIVGR